MEVYSVEVMTPNEISTYPLDLSKVDAFIQQKERECSEAEFPWYRIRKHICRNELQLPCYPWEVVVEVGEIPEEELI